MTCIVAKRNNTTRYYCFIENHKTILPCFSTRCYCFFHKMDDTTNVSATILFVLLQQYCRYLKIFQQTKTISKINIRRKQSVHTVLIKQLTILPQIKRAHLILAPEPVLIPVPSHQTFIFNHPPACNA